MNYYQAIYDNSVDKSKALNLLRDLRFEGPQRLAFFYAIAAQDKAVLKKIALTLFNITEAQFGLYKKRGGRRDAVTARYCIMWYMRKHIGYSDSVVGKTFEQDRTTVIHALKVISNYLDTDKEFCATFNTFIAAADNAILSIRTNKPIKISKLKFTVNDERNEQSSS